jgi:hypothetical protein
MLRGFAFAFAVGFVGAQHVTPHLCKINAVSQYALKTV